MSWGWTPGKQRQDSMIHPKCWPVKNENPGVPTPQLILHTAQGLWGGSPWTWGAGNLLNVLCPQQP